MNNININNIYSIRKYSDKFFCSYTSYKRNCLYYSVEAEMVDLTKELIINGIDIDINSNLYEIFLKQKENTEIITILIENSIKFKLGFLGDKIFDLIDLGKYKIINLIKNRLDLKSKKYHYKNGEYSLLAYTIDKKQKNYMKIVKILLENGMDKEIYGNPGIIMSILWSDEPCKYN